MNYTKTETLMEEKEFFLQWDDVCKERNVVHYQSNEWEEKYLILGEDKKYIGTTCFVPRNPNFSIVDGYFDFKTHPLLHKSEAKIYEVGKVSLKKEFQKEGNINKILSLIIEYSIKNDISHILGAVDQDLYAILVHRFGLSPELAREPISITNGTRELFVLIFDMKKTIDTLLSNGKLPEVYKIINYV